MRQVTMPHDQCLGKLIVQRLDQLSEGHLLRWRSGVGLHAVHIQPALVADADGVLVMSHTVGTRLPQGPPLFNTSVTTHHIVVADTLPVDAMRHTALVPVVDISSRTCLVRSYGTAMYNQ